MCCAIVVRHRPSHGEETEQEREPGTQPEPLVKCVKTHFALALFGVRTRSAIQIAVEAIMLIGANQRTISWSVLVVREQIIPKMTRIATDRRHICNGGECVADSIQCRIHACGCENHLSHGVGDTRNTCSLAKEIAPTYNPRPDSSMFWRHHILRDEIHPACGRIR